MIAVYIDNELDRHYENVTIAVDFVFKTLGYEYRYINSIEELMPNDILLFYADLEISPQDAEYVAYDQVLVKVRMEKEFWKIGFWGFQTIVSSIKKIKIVVPTPVLSTREIKEIVKILDSQHCRIVNIDFDIFANVFFHLSGYYDFLEYYSDENVIKPSQNPFYEFLHHPYLNYILYVMDETLKTIFMETEGFPTIRKDFWPRGEDYAIAISHSVDKLFKWPGKRLIKSFFEDILVFYRIKYVYRNFISKMKAILTNKEEYWNFDEICEIEKNYFIKSTYFWGTDITDESYFDYDFDDPDIIDVIRRLDKKGHDNSLLASKLSYKEDVFKSQLTRMEKVIKKPVLGLRIQNYFFDIQKTPALLKHNNIYYDATFGVTNKNGFRNGLGFPYELLFYDVTDKSKGIVVQKTGTMEIPIVFKDENLKLTKYKTISYERATKQIEELLKNIRYTNGLITFDFAISNFSDIPNNFKIYEFLLRKILKQKPYVATYSELSKWWKKRNAVHITENGNRFIIYFPEKLKQFSFHIYAVDVSNVKIEGASHKRDVKDPQKFILKDIKSNSRVYVEIR